MYDRPRVLAPEDRVLRWIATVIIRYPRGIPVDRFVRHLKADLAPLNFAQLDGALRILEGHGLIRREWDSPGEFRVLVTDAGTQQAKLLEEPPPRSIALGAMPPTPSPAPFTVTPTPPTGPAATPGATPPPSGSFRPVPLSSGPTVAATGSVVAAPLPSAAAPLPASTPAVSSLAGPVQGRSAGPIPSRGPPSSANLPVRVLLYCLLYGAAKGEAFPLVPGEDLARYLLNQGFLLSEDFLNRLFSGLQTRDLLAYMARPTGGFDLQLTPRGHQLAEGLLSGHVPLGGPDGLGAPPGPGGERPPTAEDQLQERWAAAEAANAELRKENEDLKVALKESEQRRHEDRETLDEALHQMEMQEVRVQELEEMIARMPKVGIPIDASGASSAPSDPDPGSTVAQDPPPDDGSSSGNNPPA